MHVLEAALFTQFIERSFDRLHTGPQPQEPAMEAASATQSPVFAGLARILSRLSVVIAQTARSLAGGRQGKAAHVLHCAGNGL